MAQHLVYDHVIIENKKVCEAEIIPISLEVVGWLVKGVILLWRAKKASIKV